MGVVCVKKYYKIFLTRVLTFRKKVSCIIFLNGPCHQYLFLHPNILENHFDQGEKIKKLLIKSKFKSVEIVNDLSGIGRFTIGRYK